MRKPLLFLFATVLAFSALGAAIGHAAGPGWKAGLARVKITPEQSIWMAGYAGRDHPAEGVLHELWLKVLAIEDAKGTRAVVITADHLGMPQDMYQRVCKKLVDRHGLQPNQVMLTASHTHTGPVLEGALYDIYPLDERQRQLIGDYSDSLEKKLVDAVGNAVGDLRPAVLQATEAKTTFAVNRRNNREPQITEWRKQGKPLEGPTDHTVPVLLVRAPGGKLRAVVFGYACHCTTLSSYEWSGDYAGFAQLALENEHPGVQAMFWAGCGADQNPLPRRTVELCRQYGDRLAEAVETALGAPARTLQPELAVGYEALCLPFFEQPTRAELESAAARGGYRGRWAKRLLAELENGQKLATAYEGYPVQVWRLGEDQWWIALGGEVVVDYALKFRELFGRHTWVTGYTNDVMAYIPSRRVWEEGGYESGAFAVYGLPATRWCEDIEQRITASVQRLTEQIRSGGSQSTP